MPIVNNSGTILTEDSIINVESTSNMYSKQGMTSSTSSYQEGVVAGETLDLIFITNTRSIFIIDHTFMSNGGSCSAQWFLSPTYEGGDNLNPFIFSQESSQDGLTDLVLLGGEGLNITSTGNEILPTSYQLSPESADFTPPKSVGKIEGLILPLPSSSEILLRIKNISSSTQNITSDLFWFENDTNTLEVIKSAGRIYLYANYQLPRDLGV